MDAYEATKIVMSRIQNLDPENASRIMGYILIQDQGEKEVIRLASGPDALLLSCLNQAKACLGLSPNAPIPKPVNYLSNSVRPNAFLSPNSPRILIPSNGFHNSYSNPSSPAPPPFSRSSPAHPFSRSSPISYAAVLNGCSSGNSMNGNGSDSGSPSLRFYGGNEMLNGGVRQHVQDQSSFLDGPAADASDPLIFPFGEDAISPHPHPHPHPHPFHRRSSSVNDAVFLSHMEEGGVGFRPCMYHSKGFCKNGSACKFVHGEFVGGGDEAVELGSPSANASIFDEFLRTKALQQQRFALVAGGGHHPPFGYNKSSNFGNDLNDNQRCGPRNEFSSMGMSAAMASSSRQIYLTFPSDSTFKEEDVSGYFSMFGPVQDVRIPYQQKRMFGFVTFVHSETVKLILAKGNPHFVCDSRVLVKPYKEKGKASEKRQFHQQNQHMERGGYASPRIPSAAIDSKEHFDLPIGSRALFDTQEMLRRQLELEVELQHAIELQGRRMANLELMDQTYHQPPDRHFLPSFRAGVSIPSPRQSRMYLSENAIASFDGTNPDILQEFDDWQETSKANDENSVLEETECFAQNNVTNGHHTHHHINDDDTSPNESLEHILPDHLFASPTKSAAEHQSAFSLSSSEADTPLINTSSNYAIRHSQMTRYTTSTPPLHHLKNSQQWLLNSFPGGKPVKM